MSRRVALFVGVLTAGLGLPFAAARADDGCGCFAFFRRCPPDAGAQDDGVYGYIKRNILRPPRCPPYCDPTFGYYPTMWRAWPTLYCGPADEMAAPATTTPSTTPGGAIPPTMPPASDEARRRLPPSLSPTVRSATDLPTFSGASAR